MKLKKCILSGVLAASMLCESLFGVTLMNPVQVYADEPGVDNTGSEEYENLALNKDVKTSSTDLDSQGKGSNVVDNKTDTTWTSIDLRSESPQTVQIDLEASTISVERIEIVYGSEIWDQSYTIETYDSEKNAQRHTVKTVGTEGPDASVGEIEESRNTETKTDTIYRNDAGEAISLGRYVNFEFTIPSNLSGSDAKKVSIAEIRIFGTEPQGIWGPTVELTAPVEGKYPEIAKVKASTAGEAVYHENLADRTTPAATLIKKDTGTKGTETRTVGGNNKEVSAPIWTGGTTVDTLSNGETAVIDGTYGFNVLSQTPGTLNKFDVWGTDIKIISFQLYVKQFPSGTVNLFGKGNKYAMQMAPDKLLVFMNNTSNGWPEDDYTFSDDEKNPESESYFLNKWHDILMVVDGKGVQRFYVDGKASTTDTGRSTDATAAEEPNGGLQPFSFGYNLSDLSNGAPTNIFTSDIGYLARFKFYSNKDYHNVTNGAGTDISDAAVLSDAFDDFSVAELESSNSKDDVYYIITNMLQKENPTARISLCPYSRATVWSKKTENGWVDMDATEKFAAETKYRATTTLIADEGFIFSTASAERIKAALKTDDDSAITSIKVGNKRRELTIVTYYGCDEGDVDDTCSIENLVVANDPIQVKVGETASIDAQVTSVSKCANHESAEVEITYTLPDGENRVELDEANGTIKGLTTTKGIIGHDPVQLTITAALMDGDDIVQAGNQDVKITRTVEIEVDPEETADQTIEVAPIITAQAPVVGEYPQVADIALPDGAKHFNDVADRMDPEATLEPLTTDYIKNSNYINTGAASSGGRPVQPNDAWMKAWEADEDNQYNAIVENVDGVIGFNALGQTPGDTNKFDVFGTDIKLVSFKLYLKQWPENPYDAGDDGATIDIYGKGNKYAMQITSTKRLIMYMNASQNPAWPQETYQADDNFLNKWHNIFMVVDGKGWQRLYVDGKRSTSRSQQGSAFAVDPSGYEKKPFTLGYNSKANHPSWYDGIFTNDYGYIADFEFYSDKNYDNIINGAGTDISEAQVLTKEMADIIDLEDLERKYANNLDDIGTILTNLLQERNATACITASPYVAKTNWSQKTGEKDGEDVYENLDKINAEAFTYSSNYRSVTTLTAYDGFVFKDDKAFTDAVAANFRTAGGEQATSVVATVGPNANGEANKVLTITATYGETEEAPCTCAITVAPLTPDPIEIPEEEDTVIAELPEVPDDNITISCLKEDHPVEGGQVQLSWAVAEGSEDKIEINADKKLVAKQAGTATLKLTATYQVQDDNGAWITYQNGDGTDVTTTINVNITITKKGAATPADKTALGNAANKADTDYPESVEDDYTGEAWDALQEAIAEADALSKNPNATATQVTAATTKLQEAIAALANNKSPKGLAKDALKSVLDDAALKALIEGNNADKKYTDDSFKKLTDAYAAAESGLATADEATLGTLKTALETAWKTGLVPVTTGGTGGTGVKDGDVLKGADGTQYQVASAKDKTVIITKGVDAKKITVGPTVVINNETYKVIGIGTKAFTGLKKATNVVINANVTSIGAQAFAKSKKLKSVTLGANVTTIGKKAFFNCPKLKKVTLKGTALTNKSFGKQAFKKTASKVTVKWGKVKGKAKTTLKKALKKAGMKVK